MDWPDLLGDLQALVDSEVYWGVTLLEYLPEPENQETSRLLHLARTPPSVSQILNLWGLSGYSMYGLVDLARACTPKCPQDRPRAESSFSRAFQEKPEKQNKNPCWEAWAGLRRVAVYWPGGSSHLHQRLQGRMGFQSRYTVPVCKRDRKQPVVSHFSLRRGTPPCSGSGRPLLQLWYASCLLSLRQWEDPAPPERAEVCCLLIKEIRPWLPGFGCPPCSPRCLAFGLCFLTYQKSFAC